jgi:hypothetical protein
MAAAAESFAEPDAETKRHLWRGLLRLPPAARLDFLKWCCRRVKFCGVEVRVIHSTGTHADVWHDVMQLAYSHGLSLRVAADELERRLRGAPSL